MAHTYAKIFIHCVFSTKNHQKIITEDLQERLWSYLGGIARENNIKVLAIGGVEDHAHLFFSFPPSLSVSAAMQQIKGGSSSWIHKNFPSRRNFGWQEGFGAFSVSPSRVKVTIDYIAGQKEHHRKKTFKEEYLAFLKKYGIEYDEKYLWR
jgi:putative transposase